MDERVCRVISLLKDSLNRQLSLAELAQAVNLSPSHLYHLFKAETGTTPCRYHQALRMQWAKHLLETTFLRVKEIRRAVGINSDSLFVRDFKLQYGVSPTQYRACYRSVIYAPDSSTGQNSEIRQ